MSSKIDERVVAMKFNADQFAKGVADTSGALEKLQSALKIDGSNVNLSGLTSQVSSATSAFSGLQTVALGALIAIGARIVTLGQTIVTNLTNNLTSGARDGFKEYETQINAIATILGNVKSKGEDLASVNAALDVLNKYSDKTVYNFTEMVTGIKTLTNAGVGLDQGVQVVKGFANAAALAGVSAEKMAHGMEYGLNQAITKGYLGVQDFISIQDVVGEQFRNSLMETARLHGVNVDEIIARNGSFRDSLSEGWVTSQVLMDTLSKFTGELSDEQLRSMGYTEDQIVGIQEMARTAVDAATRVRTWTQLLDTFGEQVGSGWANTWRTIIGDSEQAAYVFTMISDQMGAFIQSSNEARQSQIDLWASLGGRDALVKALENAFAALNSVLNPIKEAWAEVFPPSLGNTLAEISFWIRDFTEGLILSEDAQKNLKMVATDVFTVLKFGIDVVKGIASVLFGFVGWVLELGGAFLSLLGPVLTFVRSLLPVADSADKASSGVQGFFDMLNGFRGFLVGWLPEAIRNLSEGFDNFLNGGGAQARIASFKGALSDLAGVVAMVWGVFSEGSFTENAFFQENDKFVQILFRIREGFIAVVGAFQDFGKSVAEAGGRAKNFWEGVGNVIKEVWSYIKPLADKVGEIFGDITKDLDLDTILAGVNAGVLVALGVGIAKIIKSFAGAFAEVGAIKKSFIGALDELGGALGRFGQETKADQLIKIAGALIILAGALWIISTIDPDRLISSVTAMATSFGILLGGLAILDKMEAEPSIKASVAMTLIAAAVNILASAIVKMGSLNPQQLATGLIGMGIALFSMITAMEALSYMGDDIWKGAAALVVMAVALNMMVIPIAALGALPIEVLVQGLLAVGIVLAGLVVAAQMMAEMGPDMALAALGLIAMALALNMLVIPITALGLLPFPVLLQGLLVLGILLAGLVIVAQLLAPLGPQMALASLGLVAMAVAINLLVAPIALLGAMDIGTLIQGLIALVAVMAILVIAAMAMTGAVAGTVGMIAMAAAILILSLALLVLSGIGIGGLIVAILGLVVVLIALGLSTLILTPTIPMMFAMAGAFAVLAIGAVLLAAALLIAAIAVAMMGPALISLTAGLEVFAAAGGTIVSAVGPMMALGAGLLVFGAGALVAGVGALILGVGLVVLAAGLALIAAVGILGAVALGKVIEKITGLMVHIPGMLAMGAAFLVLGAGVLVLGAGLLVLGAGALMVGVALMILVPLGALVTVSINMIIKAIEKLAPMSGQVDQIGAGLKKMGSGVEVLAESGRAAAAGLGAMSAQFNVLSAGAMMASVAIRTMAASFPPSIAMIIAAVARVPLAFQMLTAAVVVNMAMTNAALVAGGNQANVSAARLGLVLGLTLANSIRSSYGSVYSSSVELGGQMTAGMNRGLQNGSVSVAAMARSVARTALNSAKRELGVASPSKEFTWLGEMNDAGLVKGMKNGLGAVDTAGTRVGNVAIKAVQRSLSELKNSVAIDPNMVPTIRPVLDLSNVRDGVKQMDGMLTSPRTLQVNDSYAMASALATQQRANAESASDSSGSGDEPGTGDTYIQNIYSPKAISNAEIYRNTKNFISTKKGTEPTNANQR